MEGLSKVKKHYCPCANSNPKHRQNITSNYGCTINLKYIWEQRIRLLTPRLGFYLHKNITFGWDHITKLHCMKRIGIVAIRQPLYLYNTWIYTIWFKSSLWTWNGEVSGVPVEPVKVLLDQNIAENHDIYTWGKKQPSKVIQDEGIIYCRMNSLREYFALIGMIPKKQSFLFFDKNKIPAIKLSLIISRLFVV